MLSTTLLTALLLSQSPTATAGAAPTPPALWSGPEGSSAGPELIRLPDHGQLKLGDPISKVERRRTRTARLAAPYTLVDEQGWRADLPAGSPFVALTFVFIHPVGSTPDPRLSALNWCSAGEKPPFVCLRWHDEDEVEFAKVSGPLLFDRAPWERGWSRAPAPKLVEQPVPVPVYENTVTLKEISPTGVVLAHVTRQGGGEKTWNQTVAWGRPAASRSPGVVMVFAPVQGSDGQPSPTTVRFAFVPQAQVQAR